MERTLQDASFSARGIWRYTLGATPGIQLITGENHVVGSNIVLGTEVTTTQVVEALGDKRNIGSGRG